MLHDEISLLKSQLCQMKEKIQEEMQSKRQLESIVMKVYSLSAPLLIYQSIYQERQLQHRTMMEFEKVETKNAKLKVEIGKKE